jgi:hypothetical protein
LVPSEALYGIAGPTAADSGAMMAPVLIVLFITGVATAVPSEALTIVFLADTAVMPAVIQTGILNIIAHATAIVPILLFLLFNIMYVDHKNIYSLCRENLNIFFSNWRISPLGRAIVNALPAQTTFELCSQDPYAAGCNSSPPQADTTSGTTPAPTVDNSRQTIFTENSYETLVTCYYESDAIWLDYSRSRDWL